MIICVDIDGTICTQEQDYADAKPFMDKIYKVNKLYDEGHRIIYWTARGTVTGLNWRSVTEEQFSKWGVKHHALEFGKPVYDLLFDDKARNEVE
jgi:uncharacterized HAD superfamily protein